MNALSMTASPSDMDTQQIPGMTTPDASYAQITRNSMSLWKLETRYQIRQQTAKPTDSQDSKSNPIIYGVEEHDSSTRRFLQSLRDVGSVTSILSSVDDNNYNHSLLMPETWLI